MNPEQWQQIRPILESVLELPLDSRNTFLDDACADPSLRREIDSLLLSHDQADHNALNPASFPLHFGQEIYFRLLRGKRIGPYEIVEEIAEGGMGAVYRAVRADGQYKQQVALKIVRADLGVDLIVDRFRNERQILASLDHPNIAKILDGGSTADGLPYFVMELIEGSPITEYCDQKRLTIDERLQIFRTVCSAVHYAHQHLIIHRDIKPTNILVTAERVPKLLDFGIAKLLDPSLLPENATLTAGGLCLLTPEYASPEQLRGSAITTATDLYSLGLVLYELLTGHRPYDFPSHLPHEVARAVLESEPEKPSAAIRRAENVQRGGTETTSLTPERLSSLRRTAPDELRRRLAGDLDNVVLKSIRKEPGERYNSVEQFSEDIRRHLESLPVVARRDTAGYRTSRFIKRHKGGVAAAIIVFVAVIGGLGATLYEAHIAREERSRAEARFSDVRALANSLMFDVHDSIANLPGSTPARKLLVERALRYLDSLSRDAASDASLQGELATAYEKVGTVQGNPFGANLGSTQGALESYRKSLAIRESLAKSNPEDIDAQLAVARSQRLIGAIMANRGERDCVHMLQQALAIGERLSAVAPSYPAVLEELEAGYYLFAITVDGYGDYAAASAYLEKLLPITEERVRRAPEDRALRREQARAEVRLGGLLAKIGSRKDGAAHSQRGIEILESLAADQADAESRRWLAMAHWMLGDILLLDGDTTGGLKSYQEERRIVQGLVAADPANAVLQYDFACASARVGNALSLTGHETAGLDIENQAAKLFRLQLARDPAYVEPQFCLAATFVWAGEGLARTGHSLQALESFQNARAIWNPLALKAKGTGVEADLALIHAHIGSALARLGSLERSSKEYHVALELARPIAVADPGVLEAQYALAETYAGLGELSEICASDTHSGPQQRVRCWTDARDWYQRSLNTWQGIPHPAMRTPVGFACGGPKTVARQLARCEAALSTFRRQPPNAGQ